MEGAEEAIAAKEVQATDAGEAQAYAAYTRAEEQRERNTVMDTTHL